MSDTLRIPLLLLVLLNVGFVHLTGAVSDLWVLPLYGLAAAAPWLARFQGRELYRLGWNLGILAIFGSLAFNAQRAGAMHLLEDGLLLAALCQVHLLNNLGTRQRPDLLFFNSFLIAFVTSFFSQDVGFSVLFVVYVGTLVPALQLFCATRHRTDLRLEPAAMRAILRNSVPRSATAIAATLAVFLVWPRDFDREGWVNTGNQLSQAMRMAMGLADHVNPERNGTMGAGDGIMLRVRVLDGDPSRLPTHWRGTSFVQYGRRGWRDHLGGEVNGFDRPWLRRGDRLVRNGNAALLTEVTLEQGASAWLMAPYGACDVAVQPPADANFVTSRADGNLRYEAWFDPNAGHDMSYRVGISLETPPPPILGATQRRQLLSFDGRLVPDRLTDLAVELAEELRTALGGRTAGARATAEHFAAHFHDHWDYSLPGKQGAAQSLEHFLGGAPGHCEYFATALTLMLRQQKIPARLVSGVVVTEWDDERREFVAREKHAHAWVEVWDDTLGWVTVDPTPASTDTQTKETEPGFWAELKAPLVNLWRDITTFNRDNYGSVTAWLATAPRRLLQTMWSHPWWTLLGTLLLVAAIRRWLRARRKAPVITDYTRAAKRLGLVPSPGETPRELLARARSTTAPDEALDHLASAIQAHELAHYASVTNYSK